MIDWSKYKSSPPTMKPNKMLIPVNNIGFTDEGVIEFNEIYKFCLQQEQAGLFRTFVVTKSQGISIARGNIRGAMWLLTVKKTFIEILIRNLDARYYRFIIGYGKEKKQGLSGRQAFQIYKEELLKDKVDLNDLAIENGEEVKQTIPAPRIELEVAPERTYHNAHHIDLNSAYNAGMMEKFPVLETSVRRMYSFRKLNTDYKDVLNMTQGFMQSQLCGYKFSHISKAGYDYTLRRLDELTDKLTSSGRRILSYNTDGIWYQGEIYHDEGEGLDIGQWKNDHKNCKIRYKSKGCYEFIEDGKYTPVFRGESSYEKIKPRSEWIWGDIFQGEVINYTFIEGTGVVKHDYF